MYRWADGRVYEGKWLLGFSTAFAGMKMRMEAAATGSGAPARGMPPTPPLMGAHPRGPGRRGDCRERHHSPHRRRHHSGRMEHRRR